MKLNDLFESNNNATNHHKSRAKLAKKLQVNVSDFDKMSDYDLKVLLKNVGYHDFTPDETYDRKELQKGIKIEMEHTNSLVLAKLIAKDHLSEIQNYYTRLERMEHENN